MNDMSQVIIPKSDQINAETLLGGPRTFTIKEVQIAGGQEQPVTIALEETKLFFRPCKSMSRVLVAAWGPDAKAYVGRSLTLYCDPTVKWAGMEVGGVRISHMSHLPKGGLTLALTATRGNRKPFVVKPLETAATDANRTKAENWVQSYLANPEDTEKNRGTLARLKTQYPDLYAQTQTQTTTSTTDDDSWPDDTAGAATVIGDKQPTTPTRRTLDQAIAMLKRCVDEDEVNTRLADLRRDFEGDELTTLNEEASFRISDIITDRRKQRATA